MRVGVGGPHQLANVHAGVGASPDADVDFLNKLGGRPGEALLVPDPDFRPFASGARVLDRPPKGERVRGVVFRPNRREEIPRDLRKYRALIEEDGFLWAVIPKKTAIGTLGRDVTFEDVLESALRTDQSTTRPSRSRTRSTACGS